MALKAVKCEMR